MKETCMKRNGLVVSGLILACLVLFAGCKQSGTAAQQSQDGLTVVKIIGPDRQVTIDGKAIKLSDWYSGAVPSRLWDQLQADLAERGIKLELELIQEDQMGMVFQTMLVSGKLNDYDIVNPGYRNVDERTKISLVQQGRLYSLNKALDAYSAGPAKDYYYNSLLGKAVFGRTSMEDGDTYWLSRASLNYYKDPENYMGGPITGNIRKDWLDAVGLPMPKTLDEFYNAMVAFQTKDVNGNGIKDEAANISISNFNTGIAEWFGLVTGMVAAVDDKIVSPWYQPRIKEYFAFMNKLYKAGLIIVAGEGGDMAANRVSFVWDWGIATWNENAITVQPGAAQPYFAPLIIQAVPDTKPIVWISAGIQVAPDHMHFIPSGAKNVAGAVKLIDYLVSEEYATLTQFGIEGYTFQYDSEGAREKIEHNSNTVGLDNDIIMQSFPPWQSNGPLPEPVGSGSDVDINVEKWVADQKALGFPDGYRLKPEALITIFERTYPFLQGPEFIMALPTFAQIDRINEILPDLETYSNELITSLILGEKSMSNWDSYMADLKRLGLDELMMDIYQIRFDRGIGIGK
ncbi:hypothetical protein FACS189444_2200 [Spirochaetia bacterium]|nr:hypothetical protein FACS189444_2200 [Spirochaetia bacterium]